MIRIGKITMTYLKVERWVSHLQASYFRDRRLIQPLSRLGNLIQLPDQRILLLNGAAQGAEGYGWDDFALNQSYAKGPRLSCRYFDPRAEPGQQWDEDCGTSTIPRMYHSTATLLSDGSVFVAGSNPNVDVIDDSNNASYVFHTEYRVERFYPVSSRLSAFRYSSDFS
jgi:hypothetical protein